jgi:RHS repeat-associated protein
MKPQGLSERRAYDRIAGWLDDRTTGLNASTGIQNLSYLWDENGNLTQRQDSRTGVTETFQYDALDRMYQHNRNGAGLMTVGYDAIGNITSRTGVGTYTYHLTKKHAVASTTGTINNTYQYDANGNMTSRNGQITTWYSSNLPNTINSASGMSVRFMYGPTHERWKQVRTSSSGTATVTYIGPYMERMVTATVNEFRHYIYGPTGPIAVYKRSSSGTSQATAYLTTDHLGSTDVITTAAGVQSVNMSFTAFGERKGADGVTSLTSAEETAYKNVTRRGFTFHEHLDEVQLVHMNGRVYDPVIGRFMSADPFVTEPLNGQNLNRYSYVLNNPLSYTDPSGFEQAVSHRAYSYNLMGMTGEFRRDGFSNRGERGDSLGLINPTPCRPGLNNPNCPVFPPRTPPSTGSPSQGGSGGNGGTDVANRPVLRENPVAAMSADQMTTASAMDGFANDGVMNPIYVPQGTVTVGLPRYVYQQCAMSMCHGNLDLPFTRGPMTEAEEKLLNELAVTVSIGGPLAGARGIAAGALHLRSAAIVEQMNSLRICSGTDCSEIAAALSAFAGEGRILRVSGRSGGDLRLLEYGRIDGGFKYHEVFTDGRYIYDPRLSPSAVPLRNWMQMIEELNPGAVIK